MVLEKARELGIALSETQEFQQMLEAKHIMDSDEALSALINEYQEKQQKMIEMLSGDDMDRALVASLSADVEAIQGQLTENPIFTKVMETQQSFQNLMQQVNREIGACIGMPQEEDHVCSGSCESCGGCQH